MACDEAKRSMIKGSIELGLSLIKIDGRSLGDGLVFLREDVEKVLDQLALIQNAYPTVSLYESLTGETVRFKIVVPDDLVQITDPNGANQEKLKFFYRNDFPSLLRDNLKAIFDARKPELIEKVKDSYIQLMQITDIKLRDAYTKITPAVRGELSRLRKTLKELDYTNMEASVNAYVSYLLEASVVAEEVLNVMNEVRRSDAPDKFKTLMDLHSVIVSYKPLLMDLRAYTTDVDAPLYEVVTSTVGIIGQIENIYLNEALENSLDEYEKIYQPVVDKMRRKKDEKVQKLRDRLARLTDPGKIKATNDRIAELEKNFDYEAPTRDVLRETLTGKRGDISYYGSIIRAGIVNPDFAISGMMDKIKAVFNNVNRKLVDLRQDFSEMLPKAGIDITTMNVQNSFRKFIQTYEYFYVENGEIKSVNKAAILTPYDISHLSTESRMMAEMDLLRERSLNGEDVQDQIKEKAKELKEFRRNTYEQEYTQEYYDAEELLNVEVNGKTLREYRNEILDQLSTLSSEIRFSGYRPSMAQIKKKNELLRDLRNLETTTGKQPGSVEYEVAVGLQAYRNKQRDIVSWELSPRARESFDKAKAQVDKEFSRGKITQEERDQWYLYNTVTQLSDEYFIKLKSIIERIKVLQDELSDLTVTPKNQDITLMYEELIKEVRPYRDQNGHIDASIMPRATQEKLIALEQAIYNIRASMEGFSGLSKNDRIRLSELFAKKNLITDPQELAEIKQEIDEIKAKKKKRSDAVSTRFNALMKQLSTLYRELDLLQATEPTQYFQEDYDKEFNEYKRANNLFSPSADFFFGGRYRFDGKNYTSTYKGQTLTISSDNFVDAWDAYVRQKFESESDWYERNTVETVKWDPVENEFFVDRQIAYIWVMRTPRDPRHIKTQEPAFHWKEQMINPRYLNNFTPDVKNKPPLKNPRVNAAYGNLTPDEIEYLEFITNKFNEAQMVLPVSQRLGIDLPSIERQSSFLDTVLNPLDRIKSLPERALREVVANEQDADEAFGDTSNRMVKYQPMMFSGNIDESLADLNLHSVLLRYAGQSLKYQGIQDEVLPLTTATEQVLESYSPTTDTTSKTAARWGVLKKLYQPVGENARLKVYRDLVDMFVYNQKEIQDIGNRKIFGINIRGEKLLNKLLGMRAWSLMSGSVLSQGANLMNGIIQGVITAASKKGNLPFSPADWLKAHGEVMTIYAGTTVADMMRTGNKSKFTLMMDYFQAIPEDLLNNVGYELENSLLKKTMSSDVLFFTKNAIEWELSAATFNTMIKTYTVNYRGEQVRMWDMFETKNGRLEPRDMTPQENAVFVQEMDRFIRQLNAANRDINGNYASLDKTLAERAWLGRAVFFLKKFVISFVDVRYRGRRYSHEHEAYIEGTHVAAFKLLSGSLVNFIRNGSIEELSMFYEDQDPERIRALRGFITEIVILMAVFALANAVYDEEDEDRFQDLRKESWYHQFFVYTLLKTKSEIQTFVLPFGIQEIDRIKRDAFKEVFPFLTQLIELFKTFDYSDMEFKVYERKTDYAEKGDLKITHHVMKLIGINPAKITDPVQGIKNLEAINR